MTVDRTTYGLYIGGAALFGVGGYLAKNEIEQNINSQDPTTNKVVAVVGAALGGAATGGAIKLVVAGKEGFWVGVGLGGACALTGAATHESKKAGVITGVALLVLGLICAPEMT